MHAPCQRCQSGMNQTYTWTRSYTLLKTWIGCIAKTHKIMTRFCVKIKVKKKDKLDVFKFVHCSGKPWFKLVNAMSLVLPVHSLLAQFIFKHAAIICIFGANFLFNNLLKVKKFLSFHRLKVHLKWQKSEEALNWTLVNLFKFIHVLTESNYNWVPFWN